MALNTNIIRLARQAKEISRRISNLKISQKNELLKSMAKELLQKRHSILEANKKDVKLAQKRGLSAALIDRLKLTDTNIKTMANSLAEVSKLPDPVGKVLSVNRRPNGLIIKKVSVPIGVIAIIYESRPNVTSDCAALCIKASNVVILKGGREAINSNRAIFNVLDGCAKKMGLAGAINFVDTAERSALKLLLKQNNSIDLVIPRGGEGLIRFVAENSRIPVIKHYKGVCHVYVDRFANLKMAEDIILNAKLQRPGVCNAMETLLVDEKIAWQFLPGIIRLLKMNNVEIRGCPKTMRIVSSIKKAKESDWYEEYLDLIVSVKVVKCVDEAIWHINKYGSSHSDTIVTYNQKNAKRFLERVDSACVYLNASTRFTDGGQFGMGSEIGISTDKLHARGPMGLKELTTYKYIIYGKGQIRH